MKNETIKMNTLILKIKTGTIKIKKETGIYHNFTNGTPYKYILFMFLSLKHIIAINHRTFSPS